MYEVRLEKSVAKVLKSVTKQDYNRLIVYIMGLSTEPRPQGCRKLSCAVNDWRVRVGNWRIVYEIDDRRRMVSILRVALRKEAYR